MFEYFRGWKRKAGVITLALSLVLVIAWVRSRGRCENVIRNGSRTQLCIVSLDGTLAIYETTPPRENDPVMLTVFGDTYWWISRDISRVGGIKVDDHGVRQPYDGFEYYDVDWRFRWAEFDIAAGRTKPNVGPQDYAIGVSAPYWSIVLPLTALSAWLLLSKRRQPNKPEPSQKPEA